MPLPDLQIHTLESTDLDLLRPIWVSMKDHHAALAPQFGPPRNDEDSWQRRRAHYVEWIQEPGTFVLIAISDKKPVGYALVRIKDMDMISWKLEGQYACVETLAVLPEFRGQGIGTALLAQVETRIHEQGITSMSLTVLAANGRGKTFYERHGYATEFVSLGKEITASEEE